MLPIAGISKYTLKQTHPRFQTTNDNFDQNLEITATQVKKYFTFAKSIENLKNTFVNKVYRILEQRAKNQLETNTTFALCRNRVFEWSAGNAWICS